MRLEANDPPREFAVGRAREITIRDAGRVHLDPDEQVTFVTEGAHEYDVTRKSWGFYATPSLNGRLRDHGLRSALVRNPDARYCVLLVEVAAQAEFEDYLASEELEVIAWLDDDRELARIASMSEAGSMKRPACMCGLDRRAVVHVYDAPPEGETRFDLSGTYRRELLRCEVCGHFVTAHDLDLSAFYSERYVDATYGPDGLRDAFDRIQALPPDQSDNIGRVERLVAFTEDRMKGRTRALDVGSGLGVFPARMRAAGWDVTALDPDPRACEHLRHHVGVETVCADFFHFEAIHEYDVVSFNKVLEHVEDPVAMLRRTHDVLATAGLVYVELPDGTEALRDGPEREEFFVEHWHVFSAASVALLAERAGFIPLILERLREPSGKYTLRGFLTRMDHS